ncbi:uncharacterized protein LOC124290448 [Haliotis rubra]|uniref:uncharacterized protein LOC124290448 n=1 Tax=Haliotis rubra TaxID=36100 RepID=UPI001EE4F688|nr:uncharacterized protein LOC124290448 [Haliotis rubra]
MAHNSLSGSVKRNKRRHLSSSEDEEVPQSGDFWPEYLVIAAADGSPFKLNPFAVSKGIQGVCGEVKNATRLRFGSLLVECVRRQQSVNLLGLRQFVNTQVVVSAHRTLNSCRGIVRDWSRSLSDMSEEEIADELKDQGVTAVKRFTRKQDSGTVNTNTYLFTFGMTTLPKSIKAGYCNIGVEVYVPNPLRCFQCKKFGHGAKSCHGKTKCSRCSGAHASTDCTNDMKCANCNGDHMASSKSCPSFEIESKIMKLKRTKHMSYFDAKKLVQSNLNTSLTYSAAVSSPAQVLVTKPVTVSTSCQTDISWVNDKQQILEEIRKQSLPGNISSASQTEESSIEPRTDTVSSPAITQNDVNLTATEKKKMRRKTKALQHLEESSPSAPPVLVHNLSESLDMEITPSQTACRSGTSPRSRSPIEPP